MATPKPDPQAGGTVIGQDAALAGILALLAADREEKINDLPVRRTELVLADAGLSTAEIGSVLGKKSGTVAKAISRARSKSKTSEG